MSKIDKTLYENKPFKDNNNETFIVEKIFGWDSVKVFWPETNTSKLVTIQGVKNGSIKNPAHGNKRPYSKKQWIGLTESNSKHQKFTIIEEDGEQVKVKFKKTNTEKWVSKNAFRKGSVLDNMAPSLCGVGYLGFYDRKCKYGQRAYDLWNHMISRCYNTDWLSERGYCTNVTVSKEWKCFATFLEDIKTLEGFSQWLEYKEVDFDKDVKSIDVKIYSKDTCIFLNRKINRKLRNKNDKN